MTPRIRPVGRDDLAAVRAALVASWHATYDPIHGAAKVTEITDRWHALPALSRQVDRPGTVFLMAEGADGGVLGSALAHVDDGEEACLRRLYVTPGGEGRGLGRLLLDETLARLAERDAWLEVEPRNTRAIRFYEREGFVLDRPAQGCGGRADLEAVIMRRPERPIARAVVDADAQDLFGLLTLAFAEYPGCYIDPHDDYPEIVRPATRLSQAKTTFWVIEDRSGRVRACCGVKAPDADGTAELTKLYVRRDQRRRGLAAHLVRLVEDAARAAGARRLVLYTDTRFTKAHRLYEHMGFSRFGEERALHDVSGSVEYGYGKALG
ncbi:GNAT family N-acetyltransferase [Salinarimonas sp. NSM]|uniref:GNAT family N-acetyltransferase n=1 Tax=Salinarimonas sp. NSM TaxID=3458003 RepID=UPI00403507B7